MSLYESCFIARQDLSRQDVEKLTEKFASIVRELGGNIVKQEYWGLRNLAYRIKKNRKGHYVMLALDAPHQAVTELRRTLGIAEDVIRSLIVRVDEIAEGPSAILQQRSGRDDMEEAGPYAAETI